MDRRTIDRVLIVCRMEHKLCVFVSCVEDYHLLNSIIPGPEIKFYKSNLEWRIDFCNLINLSNRGRHFKEFNLRKL